MTKNKKKLRRVERRYSVTKSAQTLVLAGMLLAGGVSGAMAAETVTGDAWKTGATITSGQDFTTSGSMPMNATLTVQSGGKITIAAGSGIIDKNEGDALSKVVLESGSTTVVNGHMDIGKIDVKNGATVTLTGTSGANWDAAAYLGGYEGLTVNGAVNMGVNSEMFIGRNSYNANGGDGFTLAIGDGANIVMEGTAFNGNAAHIWAGSPDGKMTSVATDKDMPKNLLSITGGKITVTEAKYGVISSQNTNMSGGELDVKGNLLIQANPGAKGDGGSIVYAGTKTGSFTLTNGTINVANTGKLSFGKTMAFNQNGGTVTVAGRIYETGAYTLNSGSLNLTGAGGMIGAPTDAMTEADVTGTFTMNNGTLNVGKTDGTQGSQMQMDKVTIAGGIVNIQGKVDGENWNNYALIYGGMGDTAIAGGTTITGGTINMGDRAQLGVGYNTSGGSTMVISGGTINLNGGTVENAANIRASSDATEASSGTPQKYAELKISGNAKIAVEAGKYGVILSRKTDMSGGSIEVDGTLTVAGAAKKGITGTDKTDIMTGISTATEKWGNFNLSGGSVNVGTAGKLDFATGAVTLNIGGSGVLNTTDMTIASAAVPAGGKGLYAKDVTINSGGSLIASGTSKLLSGGSLTVASGGKLTLKGNDLLTTSTSGATHTFDKNSAWAGTWSLGGTAYLTGYDKTFTYTEADLSAAYTAVKGSGSNGSVAFIGGTLSGPVSGDVEVSAPDQEVEISGSGTSGTLTVAKTVEGNTITVADGVNKVTATDGMGLVGSGGTDPLIKDTSGKLVQTIETADGTIGLGNEALKAEIPNQGGRVGDLAVTGTGKVAVEVGNYHAGKVSLSGTGSALTVNAGGALIADSITAGSGDIINVGNSAGAGTLISSDVKLGGATLFLDPDWTGAQSSVGALVLTDNKLDGKVIVGRNSMLTLGSEDATWLAQQVTKAGGLKETGITAALGIYKPVSMAAADTLTVNGALYKAESASGSIAIGDIVYDNAGTETKYSPVANTATFAKNSLLAVYAPNMEGTAALTATTGSKLVVDKDAKLMVVDGKVGQTVKITDGFTTPTVDATLSWNGNNLLTNSDMVTGTGTWNSGKYEVVMSRGARAQDLFPLLSGDSAGMVNKMYDMGLNNTQSPHAGIKFLSRATANNEKYVANATEAATTIEGAAQLAVVGATQGVTMSAVTAGSSAAISRTSMASPLMSQKAQAVALNGENLDSGLSAGDVKNGVGLWIMPLYQSTNTWGMKSGEFKTGSTSDLGGVAIGADYTFNDAFRVGVAFNVGGGYAESTGDFNKTDNNFNFWGVNLYGGWAQNNFGITADVGYTSTYSKLEQELQASMDMGAIKADVTSSAITAGLRGEYKFETSALDIIPHVGVRYMSLMTDSYDAKSNGTVFNADESYQSIWTFPIGVTFAKEIENASGWTFRPQLDLQVIPAAGDVKAKSKVRVPGIDASAELSTRVMDDITYGGGVGFDVKKGDISFGLNYNIQASEHSTSHGVFGTVRYEF